ncbi:MAG: hypothetical protein LBJ89_02765 [Holosporales bacterium]|jgi:N-glycosylase/DNA lyase|nr:hypothetical protein [Holosporales bacterium]
MHEININFLRNWRHLPNEFTPLLLFRDFTHVCFTFFGGIISKIDIIKTIGARIKTRYLHIPDFSIEQIALSGQCFRINKVQPEGTGKAMYCNRINTLLEKHGTKCMIGDVLWGVHALGQELLIIQHLDGTHKFCCSENEYNSVWIPYFDINRDYAEIKRRILDLNDPYLAEAIKFGWGLRILQQDAWEVLISFIISQRNNIPRIKKLIENLCLSAFRESCTNPIINSPENDEARNNNFLAPFPSPHVLAQRSDEFFTQIGLGYRARYVKAAAIAVSNGELDLLRVQQMQACEAIDYLKKFSGIGDKVAHCIALFGLRKLDAFPRDVWINRIIAEHYNEDLCLKPIHDIAGVAQQYMFFFEREQNRTREL